jgi:predicted nucleic acid-binding protein
MSAEYFLDTNVFYSFDEAAPVKRDIARKLTADALRHNSGFVSWQVVQES